MSRPALRRPGTSVDPACPLDWSHPLNAGLVGDWSIVPNSGWRGGVTLRDLVRGGRKPNDGTLTGGAGWSARALLLTGNGQFADCGSNGPWAATATALTVEVTCSPSTASDSAAFNGIRNIISASNDASGLMQFSLRTQTGNAWLMVVYDGSSYYTASATLTRTAGHVYHLVGTYSAASGLVTVYVRDWAGGYASNSVAGPSSVAASSTAPLRIGGTAEDSGQRQWLGQIFSARYSAVDVTASKTAALYAETRRGNPERWRWLGRRAWSVPVTAAATGGGRDLLSQGGVLGANLLGNGTLVAA